MKDTKTKILDIAERMTQQKGFNGFSYIDLAEEVGVKTSSIHYHFKAKADLGLALVERTHEVHVAEFRHLNKQVADPEQRLTTLIDFFQSYIKDDKFCLCGMLTAEMQSVSVAVRSRLKTYFEDVQSWVAAQLQEMGIRDSRKRALSFICALEGSLLIARLNHEPLIVTEAMEHLRRE